MVAVGTASAQQSQTATITNEHRLLQRFMQDGAVTENIWLEGQFRFQSFQDSDVISLSPILAFTVAEDLEFGGRIGLKNVDPENASSESGFGDLDVYGKVRVTTGPTQTCLGLLLDFPTGDEDKSLRLGSGELDVGFFGGLRHDFGAVSLVGNAGLRVNQDPDVEDKDVLRQIGLEDRSEAEGETSIQLGGALLFAMTARASGLLELSYETERVDGMGADFRITVGGDYRVSEVVGLRVGVAGGAGDSAPDFEVIASGILLF
jgi:hypothetical protein